MLVDAQRLYIFFAQSVGLRAWESAAVNEVGRRVESRGDEGLVAIQNGDLRGSST